MRSRQLPHLLRIDEATHKHLKSLKKKLKKSMAQIVIDLVAKEYLVHSEE